MININETKILEVNLGGRGGKESLLSEVFSNIKRTDEELFDAITQDGTRLEFKKQANTQWFDAGKYHNLSEADQSILMTFILTTKTSKRKNIKAGLIDKIWEIF